MTTTERNVAMAQLDELNREIAGAEQELWDAELNDEDCDAEFWTDELLTLESKKCELLEKFPEVKYWPARA